MFSIIFGILMNIGCTQYYETYFCAYLNLIFTDWSFFPFIVKYWYYSCFVQETKKINRDVNKGCVWLTSIFFDSDKIYLRDIVVYIFTTDVMMNTIVVICLMSLYVSFKLWINLNRPVKIKNTQPRAKIRIDCVKLYFLGNDPKQLVNIMPC
jgi:hypothetical protein